MTPHMTSGSYKTSPTPIVLGQNNEALSLTLTHIYLVPVLVRSMNRRMLNARLTMLPYNSLATRAAASFRSPTPSRARSRDAIQSSAAGDA